MKDSLFGLDRAGGEDGMTLLCTVHDDAELAIFGGILEDEQIPFLTKDRGSGGVVRVIAGYSVFGTDAYRNGTPVEDGTDPGTPDEED